MTYTPPEFNAQVYYTGSSTQRHSQAQYIERGYRPLPDENVFYRAKGCATTIVYALIIILFLYIVGVSTTSVEDTVWGHLASYILIPALLIALILGAYYSLKNIRRYPIGLILRPECFKAQLVNPSKNDVDPRLYVIPYDAVVLAERMKINKHIYYVLPLHDDFIVDPEMPVIQFSNCRAIVLDLCGLSGNAQDIQYQLNQAIINSK